MKSMRYNGYVGSVEVDLTKDLLFGKVLFINDLITYQASTPAELFEQFKESVDIYIDTCKEIGQEPKKSFTGSFNIRIEPSIHEELAYKSNEMGVSLNGLISKILESYVDDRGSTEVNHHHRHTVNFIPKIDTPSQDKPQVQMALVN